LVRQWDLGIWDDEHEDRPKVDQPLAEGTKEEFANAAEPPAPDDQEVASHLLDVGHKVIGPPSSTAGRYSMPASRSGRHHVSRSLPRTWSTTKSCHCSSRSPTMDRDDLGFHNARQSRSPEEGFP
jgi:hypothetical protein